MNEAAIITAVDHLNEQFLTLPYTIPCSLEEVYPDFDDPECGPEAYLALVEGEIKRVKEKIRQAGESQSEPLRKLLVMLQECATALHSAGV